MDGRPVLREEASRKRGAGVDAGRVT